MSAPKSTVTKAVATALDDRVAEIQASRLLTIHEELNAALAAVDSLGATRSVRQHLVRAIAELEAFGRSIDRQHQSKTR